MSSTMGTLVDCFSPVDLSSLVGQPTRTMSFAPGLLLAVAPAWYLFVGKRAPFFYHAISTLHKVTLALVALAVELQLQSARSELYNAGPNSALIVLFSFLTFWAISFTAIMKSGVIAAICLDVLLVVDCIKTSLFMYRTGITIRGSLLAISSIIRATLFLLEGASCIVKSISHGLPPHLTVSSLGFSSIWESPFTIASLEKVDELGTEFSSARLWRRFNAIWVPRGFNKEPSRFALLRTLLLMFKWEFGFLCVIRFCVGIATICQSHAVHHALTIIENDDADIGRQSEAVLVTALVYFSGTLLEQAFARLMARYLTCIRGTLNGQVFNKILRLKAQDSSSAAATSISNTDIEEVLASVPGLIEMAASAVELGAGISSLWKYIRSASFTVLLPSICTIIPSSMLVSHMSTIQDTLSEAVHSRVSESTQAFLSGKVAKMIGLESTIGTYLQRLYQRELAAVKSFRYIQMFSMSLVMIVERFTPFVVLFCALKWTTGNEGLRANTLFPTLILLHSMVYRLQHILVAYSRVAMLLGPHNRIQAFLSKPEIKKTYTNIRPIRIGIHHSIINNSALHPSYEILCKIRATKNNDQIQLHNVTIKPPGTTISIFQDVTVSVPRGKLTVVIGPTASGKSLFLRTLLGEVYCIGGELFIERGITFAYCAQTVWLRRTSVKDNILGGQPLNEEHYAQIVVRCGLSEELKTLALGDDTIVDKNARNLTRSQQYKIILARAAYSPASVVLVDDPFSSLDPDEGQYIFKALFGEKGYLRSFNKTVVLATRCRKYLYDADLAVFLDGENHVITRESGETFPVEPELLKMLDELSVPRTLPEHSSSLAEVGLLLEPNPDRDGAAIQQQAHNAGESTIVAMIMRHSSKNIVLGLLLKTCLAAAIERVPDLLASYWICNHGMGKLQIAVYISIGIATVMLFIASWHHCFQIFIPGFARGLYQDFVNTMTRATMTSLIATDHSQAANELAQDTTLVTRGFAMSLWKTLYFTFVVLADVVILASVPGCATPVAIYTLGLLYLTQQFYMPLSRRLKGFEQDLKLPLLRHITDITTGIEQIRTFCWQADLMNEALEMLDNSQPSFYCHLDAKRWLKFALDSLSSIMIILVVVLGVCLKTLNADKVGLALFILTTFNSKVVALVQDWSDLDTRKESIRRIRNYTSRTPMEPREPSTLAPIQKFKSGVVEFHNVEARYLDGVGAKVTTSYVNLEIGQAGKAVMPRTFGSNKGSLLLAALKFLPYSGSIKVGGRDIAGMPRSELRSQITVLPPDAIHLPGTIEQNLMPWRLLEEFKDNLSPQIIDKVLEDVGLLSYIEQAGGLESPRKALNLSGGQQTQFSLGRFILHQLHFQNNVVFMDELTGNLDVGMRAKLDRALRKYLADRTVLVVGRNPWQNRDTSAVTQQPDGHPLTQTKSSGEVQ